MATPQGFRQSFLEGALAQNVLGFGGGVYEIEAPRPHRLIRPLPNASFAAPLKWYRPPRRPSLPPPDSQRLFAEVIEPYLTGRPGVTLIPAPPRSGKTLGAVEIVRQQPRDRRTLYIAPTRDLAVSFSLLLAQQGVEALLHLGRGVGVVRTRWGDYDATNCHPSKIEEIATAFSLGRNPDEVCAACPHSEACLYRKTRAAAVQNRPGVVVTTHRSAELLGIPADFVIVDESPSPETIALPRWVLSSPAEGEVGAFLQALNSGCFAPIPPREALQEARRRLHPAGAFLALLERPGRIGVALTEDSLYAARLPVLRYPNGVLLDATPVQAYAQAVLPEIVWNSPPFWKGVNATLKIGISRAYARRLNTDPATRFDQVAHTAHPGIGSKDAYTHAYFYATRGKGGLEGQRSLVVLAGYYLSPPPAQVALAACLSSEPGVLAAKWQWLSVGELETGEEFYYPFPAADRNTDPTAVAEALQAIGRCFPVQHLNVLVYGILRLPRIRTRVILAGEPWFPKGRPADFVARLR